MTAPPVRVAEVGAGRFAGWVDRFRAGHGGAVELGGGGAPGRLLLLAADGAWAELDIAFDPGTAWPDLEALLAHVTKVGERHPYLLLLLRRGGWAVGRCEGERVVASKVGTRYVQGRTKKGGSSQQRYARRRGNQADSVVSAAVDAAPGIWGDPRQRVARTLVTGGDGPLLAQAVEGLSQRLPLTVVSRRLDVPNPRRTVLDDAARAACAVRVRVRDA